QPSPQVLHAGDLPSFAVDGKVGDALRSVSGDLGRLSRLVCGQAVPSCCSSLRLLASPLTREGGQFYHPTSRRVLSSQDVMFDESVPYYRVSQVDAVEPVEVASDSGAVEGAEPGGADSGGAERVGATPGGAEPEGATKGGAESGGAEPGGATPGGAEPRGAEPGGATLEVLSLGVRSLRELGLLVLWLAVLRASCWSWGAAGTGGSVAAEGAGATGRGGARAGVLELLGLRVLSGAGAAAGVGAEATAVGPGGGPAGVLLVLLEVLELELLLVLVLPLGVLVLSLLCLESPARPRRTSFRSFSRFLMSLHPSTAPLRAPLPSPPESSLPALADPESDSLRAASPTVTRLLATVVTDHSFESTAASALVAELVDFAARCRLDYAASLVAESESVCPPSVWGECALGTDVLEDRQEEFQCLAAASPHLVSVLLTPEGDPDALDIPTPRSYAEAIEGSLLLSVAGSYGCRDCFLEVLKHLRSTRFPHLGRNIVSGIWIFRVKRPPGSPPVFKARYVARSFSQRQGVDYFQTFSPTPKMTTLRVLLHIAAQRDYELNSLDFSTAFLAGQPARGDLACAAHLALLGLSSSHPVEPPAASLRSPPGTA
ncbi:unnamed protein product, partial [Closterium sp. NIES-65]